jgi:hypothetical protein
MNWKRGLIRLWLLASIAMTGTIGWVQWDVAEERCYYGNFRYIGNERHFLPNDPTARQKCENAYEEEFSEGGWQSLGASAALFIVGAVLVWGVRGFQRKEAQA